MRIKKKINSYYLKVIACISRIILPCKSKNACSSLPCEKYSSIMKKSDILFLENKLFLDNNLTINDLAKEVGTNRTYLSISIKTIKNQSFSDYLNSTRVEYSKIIIKEKLRNCKTGIDNSGMNIEDYAIASGFSSARNFVRCFKLKEGITPTQFKNALLWRVRE